MLVLKGMAASTCLSDDDACYLAGLKSDVHFVKFLSRIAKATIAWLLEFNLGIPRFDISKDALVLYKTSHVCARTFAYATTALRLINASQSTDCNFTARKVIAIRIERWLTDHEFQEQVPSAAQ